MLKLQFPKIKAKTIKITKFLSWNQYKKDNEIMVLFPIESSLL